MKYWLKSKTMKMRLSLNIKPKKILLLFDITVVNMVDSAE